VFLVISDLRFFHLIPLLSKTGPSRLDDC
jgi:hypothetical protein